MNTRGLQVAWLLLVLVVVFLTVKIQYAQQRTEGLTPAQIGQEANLPPPQRLRAPFQAVWTEVERAYQGLGFTLDTSVETQGKLTSQFRDYYSGPGTAGRLDKVAVRPQLSGSSWVKIRYRVETEVQLIEPTQTLVTASATVEAMQRDFTGKETWVQLPSRGTIEADVLMQIGQNLFGERFELDWPRKPGYWNRPSKEMPQVSSPRGSLPTPDRQDPRKKPPPPR